MQHTWYLYHCCPVQRTGFPCIPLYIHLYYDKILMICFQLIHHKDLKVTQRIILTCFGRKIKLSKIQVILLLMGCIWKMIFSQSIYYSSHLEHKHIKVWIWRWKNIWLINHAWLNNNLWNKLNKSHLTNRCNYPVNNWVIIYLPGNEQPSSGETWQPFSNPSLWHF